MIGSSLLSDNTTLIPLISILHLLMNSEAGNELLANK